MKAMAYRTYGSPEVLDQVELPPPIPRADEIQIEVHAASIDYADWAFVRGKPFIVRLMGAGFLRPKNPVLGADIAGRVTALGEKARRFRVGEEVFGDISECGWGGFAEFVCARESAVVLKPRNVSYLQAAATPQAAVTAMQGLIKAGKPAKGQHVLIVGASGGIGTFAVQIAKLLGAEVSGVCSTQNVDLVRSIGADHVIDYTREDFADKAGGYDIILSIAGNRSIADYKRALKPGGVYIMIGGDGGQLSRVMLFGPWASVFGNKRVTNLASMPSQHDLAHVADLLASGDVVPVIGRVFPLEELPAALNYYGRRHSRGKVVIEVDHAGKK